MTAPLVILDRDGVLNEDSDDYIKSPDEWIAIPGSVEAVARLNRAGIRVVVATNQSGVGRGYFSAATLAAIHHKMEQTLAAAGAHLDGIFVCPHAPDAGCDCRKPAAGLLDQIAAKLSCDLAGVPLVGDSLRDLETAVKRQCRPVLVLTGKGKRTQAKGLPAGLAETPIYADLAAFVTDYLEAGRQ